MSAREIIQHYRGKGMRDADLRQAVQRHSRLLGPLDPELGEELRWEPLTANVKRLRVARPVWRKARKWTSRRQMCAQYGRRQREGTNGFPPHFRPTRIEWDPGIEALEQ